MNDLSYNNSKKQCNINDVICCGVLEKLDLYWFYFEDGTKVMPCLIGLDGAQYRVNYCPSCGEYVRGAKLKL